jgi:hypothetical protein
VLQATFPQRVIQTLWFNREPVILVNVASGRSTSRHMAIVLREHQPMEALVRAVELLRELRRVKSAG